MAVCEFGIITGLLLHTENGTAEIVGSESRGNKAGFHCTCIQYQDMHNTHIMHSKIKHIKIK